MKGLQFLSNLSKISSQLKMETMLGLKLIMKGTILRLDFD